VRLLHEGTGPEHLRTLRSLVDPAGTRGGRVHDAQVAAICLDHGVKEIWTADRDFSRCPLRTRNPLLGH
jgi:predicted nucleic acid-binding protein